MSLHSFFKPVERHLFPCISVDLDGTVADISKRLGLGKAKFKREDNFYWDFVLDGALYHMDDPIPGAKDFLNEFRQKYNHRDSIVYLSGRRKGSEKYTREWLQKHGFPEGRIIHREKGNHSLRFKQMELIKLKSKYESVVGHFGDRDDDMEAAKQADVKFYRINGELEWRKYIAEFFPEQERNDER
jgi:acid phosphatase class B